MDGHYVLIVVESKGWYHWSASKGGVASSQGFRTCAGCDEQVRSGLSCLFWIVVVGIPFSSKDSAKFEDTPG